MLGSFRACRLRRLALAIEEILPICKTLCKVPRQPCDFGLHTAFLLGRTYRIPMCMRGFSLNFNVSVSAVRNVPQTLVSMRTLNKAKHFLHWSWPHDKRHAPQKYLSTSKLAHTYAMLARCELVFTFPGGISPQTVDGGTYWGSAIRSACRIGFATNAF